VAVQGVPCALALIRLAVIFTESNIIRCSFDEARRLGAKIHLDCEVTRVDTTTPSVKLSSGKVYTGDVVVGADGKPRPFDVIICFSKAKQVFSLVSATMS
jgi:glycine/D-amino acid oxidase-like deaminating enzyme